MSSVSSLNFWYACSILTWSNLFFQQNPAPSLLNKWKSGVPFQRSKGGFTGRGVAVLQGHPNMDLVFVTDSFHHRIQSFRYDGTAVKQWGSEGSGDGQFFYPQGVAVLVRSQDRGLVQSQDRVLARSQDRGHPTNHWILVADSWNHRVQVFDVDGIFLFKWDLPPSICPHGIAVHPTMDFVCITDHHYHRVQILNLDGTVIRKWGCEGSKNGQFNRPNGVAVHPTRDLIFISEEQGHRIQAFRSDGTFLFKWGSNGYADGQFDCPRQIGLHPVRELLFVVDSYNHRVVICDLDGSFVCQLNSDKDFDIPSGIAVHPTNDVIYVGDIREVLSFSLFASRQKRKRIDS